MTLTDTVPYDVEEHGEDGGSVTVWVKLPKDTPAIEGVYALSIVGGLKAAKECQQVATYGSAYRVEREGYDVWCMRFSTAGLN